jgi:hypothetical protein
LFYFEGGCWVEKSPAFFIFADRLLRKQAALQARQATEDY